jgi:hypothetical protein
MAEIKRKSVRFQPDPNSLAVVAPSKESMGSNFVGLVLDESTHGCRAAFRNTLSMNIGDQCAIAVGKLAPLLAKVAWRKDVSSLLVEYGFQFLE